MEDPKSTLKRLLDASTLTGEEKRWLLRYLETTDTNELRRTHATGTIQ